MNGSVSRLVALGSRPLFCSPQKRPEPAPQQKVPRYDAAAVVKLVPVRVLDADGNPVTDLKKEEFTLFDNGARKVITEFEVHGIGPARPGAAKTETGVAMTPVPDIGRKYFIYLDFQASDVNGNANAKKAALEFVETRLLPGDEARPALLRGR